VLYFSLYTSVNTHWGAWRKCRKCQTGGYGISFDRDSVSKKFQSRIVLGKNEYLYTAGRAARVVQERSGSACHTSIKSRPTKSEGTSTKWRWSKTGLCECEMLDRWLTCDCIITGIRKQFTYCAGPLLADLAHLVSAFVWRYLQFNMLSADRCHTCNYIRNNTHKQTAIYTSLFAIKNQRNTNYKKVLYLLGSRGVICTCVKWPILAWWSHKTAGGVASLVYRTKNTHICSTHYTVHAVCRHPDIVRQITRKKR